MTESRHPRRRATDATGRTRQQILEERAARLAAPPPKKSAEGSLDVVEFRVGPERYAVETGCVQEVFQSKVLTIVPGTPPFIAGIINVRGRMVSVVDIRGFFGLPPREGAEACRVLILHSPEMEFALLADEIVGVARIDAAGLQAVLPTLQGVRAEYLKGVTADRLVVLDAARMLSDPDLVVHEEVSA
jgi:purine-binding chemotaxis protein CheW